MQIGFFDIDTKYKRLSELGDPLEKINELIDFNMFKDIVEPVFYKKANDKNKNPKNAGRRPLDPIMIIKILFLKRFYNLSHPQTEFQINDRHSFQRFIGLDANKSAPDFSTIWKYEEKLTCHGCIDAIFRRFNQFLDDNGYGASGGSIIDATIVEVPKQRNSKKENKQIKQGKVPGRIKKNPKVKSQKDLDARWTKKHNVSYFGYKDHTVVDQKTKLIIDYEVTSAEVHDSQPATYLIDPDNTSEFWADSAYQTPDIHKTLKENKIKAHINEKGYRNKPLTRGQKIMNKKRSRIRCRVEHVFGFMENSMNSIFIRTIGITRAGFQIGWMNTIYNMCRYIQLQKVMTV
jgi:IS5 family transposase